jgi:hypothetical protein
MALILDMKIPLKPFRYFVTALLSYAVSILGVICQLLSVEEKYW